MGAITTRRLAARFAASVEGVDLSQPLSDAMREDLRAAFLEHRVLVFRGQPPITVEQQIDVMSTFGLVIDENLDGSRHMMITAEPNSTVKPGRLLYHLDNHFLPEPLELLSLYGLTVDEASASTLFADNAGVVESLPSDLLERVADLEAVHTSYYMWGQGGDRSVRSVEPGHPEAPTAVHPVLAHHARTGAPFVFVTELHTHHVVDWTRGASDALLDELATYLYAPENVYEHRWEPGDLIIWDNRAVQHARGPVPSTEEDPHAPPRTLRRVSVGTKGAYEQLDLPENVRF